MKPIDEYTKYEQGLIRLLNILDPDHPQYSDALVYQHRLNENITQSRLYGNTEARKAERAEIISQLDRFTSSVINLWFVNLCESSSNIRNDQALESISLGEYIQELERQYWRRGTRKEFAVPQQELSILTEAELYFMGRQLIANRDYIRAAFYWNELVQKAPENLEYGSHLRLCVSKIEREIDIQKAVWALYGCAVSAMAMNDYESAISYLEKALLLAPEDKWLEEQLNRSYSQIKDSLRHRIRNAMANAQDTVSILFLSSEPTDTSRLRLNQELREIRERIQLSTERDTFIIEQRVSVRPKDFTQALLDVKPQIVHFSGHGRNSGEICLEDETGKSMAVDSEALAELFSLVSDQVKCVILNACFSEKQARAIVKHIPYVIGMNQAISDKAAIAFSVGFYQALGAGYSIVNAYDFGRVQIRLLGVSQSLVPVLIEKGSFP